MNFSFDWIWDPRNEWLILELKMIVEKLNRLTKFYKNPKYKTIHFNYVFICISTIMSSSSARTNSILILNYANTSVQKFRYKCKKEKKIGDLEK